MDSLEQKYEQADRQQERVTRFVNKYHVVTIAEITTFGCLIKLGIGLGPTPVLQVLLAAAFVAAYHYGLVYVDRLLHRSQ